MRSLFGTPVKDARKDFNASRVPLCGVARLELNVVFDPDFIDQAELDFEEVDLVLLPLKDIDEQVARPEIAHTFRMCDCLAQPGNPSLL
jgi:hypothetical protein